MPVKIVDLAGETGPTEDDLLVIRDNNTGTTRKITIETFLNTFSYRFVPRGAVLPYAGSSPPTGFLMADGSAVDRTTYSQLFDLIGTIYGPGNGVDTFNLPDMRGRVPVGKSAAGTFSTLNNSGGAETHVLSWNEMPQHYHTGSTDAQGWHSHTGPFATNQIVIRIVANSDAPHGISDGATTRSTSTDGLHAHNFITTNAGGNAAHNNLQPYRVVNFIIKY